MVVLVDLIFETILVKMVVESHSCFSICFDPLTFKLSTILLCLRLLMEVHLPKAPLKGVKPLNDVVLQFLLYFSQVRFSIS